MPTDSLATRRRSSSERTALQAVALDRRLLELLGGRGRAHALLELALDLPEASREEVDHAVDALAVLLASTTYPTQGASQRLM